MDAANLTITLFILGCAVPFTIEAIKVTGRLRWTLASVSIAFVSAAALWLPIASAFPRVAGFVGAIAADPISWFLLLFALVVMAREWWSKFPRIKASKTPAPTKVMAGPYDVREYLDGLLDSSVKAELGIETLTANFAELNSRVALLRTDLEDTDATASTASEKGDAAQASADYANNKLREREGTVEAIDARINDLVEFADRMSGAVAVQGSEVAAVVKTVDRLLKAQFAMKTRDALDHNEVQIAADDALLFFPTAEDVRSADWSGWTVREGRWRHSVSTWIRLAKPYGNGDLSARIMNVNSDTLRGEWSLKDSDFPDGDRMIQYRTFCIMRANFAETKALIDEAIYQATYS